MKRVIKDYNSIEKRHLDLIAAEYPEGFEIEDLITFRKADGSSFRGLEIKTDDFLYLFKIDTRMLEAIDDHTDGDFTLDSFSESDDYDYESSDSEDDD
ncbi:hypothetical protein [Sanyastnella coralliicola]|uniref:hypothetical protein n=1 Tax=Sanyastnella coralliicola TaxID=3069118 RepID=UPI0027B8B005|nr:hypothetical protein [Longitalea sp. SCSIO 12813]